MSKIAIISDVNAGLDYIGYDPGIPVLRSIINFDDEHYFSRYFKKHTGISPTVFRETVGIAQIAYSSM